jgi:hypothetical protein
MLIYANLLVHATNCRGVMRLGIFFVVVHLLQEMLSVWHLLSDCDDRRWLAKMYYTPNIIQPKI